LSALPTSEIELPPADQKKIFERIVAQIEPAR
jgi:hypothetical protein